MTPQKHRNRTIRFDHAAVATNEPEKLKRILKLIGLFDDGSEPVPSQGVVTHFFKPASSEPAVEILEVSDPKGVVAKFLEKRGPGVHHLSFQVDYGLDELCSELKEKGVRLTYENLKPGAHHTLVNFIHPESTGGVLIELSQKVS